MTAFALDGYKKRFSRYLLERSAIPDRIAIAVAASSLSSLDSRLQSGASTPPGDSRFKVVIRIAADVAVGRPDV